MVLIAFSVASIEYLIGENRLVGVNELFDVGQLIPFLVGAFGLVGALVSIVFTGEIFKPRCLVVFKHHLS